MEIVVAGRHTDISAKFRAQVDAKLSKVEQLAPRVQRVDVLVSHEPNARQSDQSEKVEITVVDKGPVVRAEATAADRYAALDVALGKLLERLRRVRDRRKDHRGAPVPPPVQDAVPSAEADDRAGSVPDGTDGGVVEFVLGDSPVTIREKVHPATAMTVDDALYEMELVGHPFFLFIDASTAQPAVVYRRHGWTYGVIKLDSTVSTVSTASTVGTVG